MKKFTYVIGNPPYQDDSVGDQKTFAPPMYNSFMDGAYEVSDHVMLITPARFLYNAGATPKAWNEKMLADPHLKVIWHEQDSSKVFPNTDIKGGVAVTYHDNEKDFGAIGTYTQYDELNDIMHKVVHNPSFHTFSDIVITRTAYRLTDAMHREHPEAISQLSNGHAYDMSTNIFERLPQIFFDVKPDDEHEYIQIYGRRNNERVYLYVRADYVNSVVNLYKWKVFLAKSNGAGTYGEILTPPIVAKPGIGNTESFISIGICDTQYESEAISSYIKTKFARSLLGVLKITQDITPEKWAYVPLQDFAPSSDIDWSAPIPAIDQQLYSKYNLDPTEISFIESHVKPMD